MTAASGANQFQLIATDAANIDSESLRDSQQPCLYMLSPQVGEMPSAADYANKYGTKSTAYMSVCSGFGCSVSGAFVMAVGTMRSFGDRIRIPYEAILTNLNASDSDSATSS